MCKHHNLDFVEWRVSLENPNNLVKIVKCADCGLEIEEVYQFKGWREKGTDGALKKYKA